MDVLIGREGGRSRLRVSVYQQDKFCGNPGSVPKSVSRQHCKLTVGDDGSMVIANLKPDIDTYVNGLQIEKKQISMNDRVELGQDRYLLNLDMIMNIITNTVPSSYSIQHLKEVWEIYHEEKLKIQIKERRFNAISSISGVFSMSAVVLGPFLSTIPNIPLSPDLKSILDRVLRL